MTRENGDERPAKLPRIPAGVWPAAGLGAGVALGVALDNIAVGVAVGLGLALLLGVVQVRNR